MEGWRVGAEQQLSMKLFGWMDERMLFDIDAAAAVRIRRRRHADGTHAIDKYMSMAASHEEKPSRTLIKFGNSWRGWRPSAA